jgi:serine protease
MAKSLARTLIALGSLAAIQALHSASAQQVEPQRIIVKWRSTGISAAAQSAEAAAALAYAPAIQPVRMLATGGELLQLDRPLPKGELAQLLQSVRSHAAVEYAEVDSIMKELAPDQLPADIGPAPPTADEPPVQIALTPNDPLFGMQWNYSRTTPGLNVARAWDADTGHPGILVAVLSTGYRPHPDLNIVTANGWDFISQASRAQDGDGRDQDETDVGDYNTIAEEFCPVENSSWNGTHAAGVIAARGNNGIGIAGIAFATRVIQVRVAGRCGGTLADIAEGMRWAAGDDIPNTAPALPARVIMLAHQNVEPCPATLQNAIDFAHSRGSVVVVPAGTLNVNSELISPGNCRNVIAVASLNRSGAKASYSAFGGRVDVAVPNSDGANNSNWIWTTSNAGTTVPGADSYAPVDSFGTLAAAQVSGVVALMLARVSAMTPDQVESQLRSTTRRFFIACSLCGTGIVNAAAAIGASPGPAAPVISASSPRSSGDYSVSWPAVSGAQNYFIERRAGSGTFSGTTNQAGTTKGYTNQPAADYWHRARSCNLDGCSAWTLPGAHVRVCPGSGECL